MNKQTLQENHTEPLIFRLNHSLKQILPVPTLPLITGTTN